MLGQRVPLALAALALLAGTCAEGVHGKITFSAASRRHAVSPASAHVLARFFARHPSSAAAELLAPNAWSPTDVPHVFACDLSEMRMFGQRLRPTMRVSLTHAPTEDGQVARGAWLVRADDLSLGGQVGGALEGVSCCCETSISWAPGSDGAVEAQLWCEAQLRVSFDPPSGFRRAAKGPVERIGSAALAAVLGASVGASLRSTVLALERYSLEAMADGLALAATEENTPWAEEASDAAAEEASDAAAEEASNAAAEAAEARAGTAARARTPQAEEATALRPRAAVAAEASLFASDLPLAALAADGGAQPGNSGGASDGIPGAARARQSGGGTPPAAREPPRRGGLRHATAHAGAPAPQGAAGLGWPALARPAADSLLRALANALRGVLILALKLGGWARMQSERVRAGSSALTARLPPQLQLRRDNCELQ
ncbi:hypothetical protein T492DRAFT_1021698 [Pavlovales sp. CCMP2436]|nr:hypothetical protein T492DRAFT_1021698 [Pavlovales sp. CCMP2436]